jgi:GNAT superfamily N-acetyltransferase
VVTVRWARAGDALAVSTVHVRSWKVAYRGLVDQGYLDRLDAAQRLEAWRQGLAESRWPDRGTLVAERDGEVVGFAHLSTGSAGASEIHAMYVVPEAWGTGAGRALMDAAINQLEAAGCTEVILWVLATNERARRFYEKAGWHADGGEAPHDIDGVEHQVVRYRLAVNPPRTQ